MDNSFLAYALVIVGLILMAAEIFVPTGGILFVLAVAALIAGIAMSFSSDVTQGMITNRFAHMGSVRGFSMSGVARCSSKAMRDFPNPTRFSCLSKNLIQASMSAS